MPKTLEGFVGDSAGLPLNGLVTTVTKVADGSAVTSGATDIAGRWNFTGLSTTDEYFVKTVDAAGRAVVRGPWSGELRSVWVRDRLEMPAAGVAVLPTDSSIGGSPILTQASGDTRYVNTAGDTMTGTLTINSPATLVIAPTTWAGSVADAFTLVHAGDTGFRYTVADAVGAPYLRLQKARGTPAAMTRVLAGDALGGLVGFGRYGSTDADTTGAIPATGAALIAMVAEEAHTSTARGTGVTFQVTPLGSTTRAERFRIDNTGLTAITASGSTALRLQGGGANDNTQLRFKGNASAVDQWAIGNEISTGSTGRNFDIYDLVSGVNRLRIASTGVTTLGTGGKLVFPNEIVDDKITLYTGYTIGIRGGTLGYFVGTSAAHRFYVDGTDRLNVEGTQVFINAPNLYFGNGTTAQTLQMHSGSGGAAYIAWLNQSAAADQKRWEMIGDSAGQLYIRAVNDAYSVAPTAMLFSRSGSTVTQVSFPTVLAQSGGYAYLGSHNVGAPIYPRAGLDVAIGWNSLGGARDMSFWNTDTAATTSFQFWQLLTASTRRQLLKINADGTTHIYGTGTASPYLNVRDGAGSLLFGVQYNGTLWTNQATEASTNGWGAVPASANKKIQVCNTGGSVIGYIPIWN